MIIRENFRNIHPRLFCGRDEIEGLRRRAEESEELKKHIDTLRQRADSLLDTEFLTEEYANAAMTQHGNFYEIGAQLENFVSCVPFLYQLGETKYTEKIRSALLHYAKFAAWTGPSNKFRKIPWQSDLSTTRILTAFAITYDMMYDAFTEEERALFREAMMNLAIKPLLGDWLTAGERVHALDSMGHNWWSVCTGLAGIGLCAIYDEVDGSLDTMADIIRSMGMFCEYESEPMLNKVSNFDNMGMFYESCGYFNYGIGELSKFLFVYRRCFSDSGESNYPILEKVPDAFLSMVYPVSGSAKNYHVNFGDSALTGGFTLLPQYLLLLGYGDENLSRFYTRIKTSPDIYDLLYPELLGKKDDIPPVYPQSAVYPKTGLAFLRSSSDEDAIMLSVRCGFTWNHAHDDAGTFILFANGENLLSDSGTVNYGKSDYVSHYCAAEGHNVVTVNGKGQWHENSYRGNKFSGSIPHFVEDGKLAYLVADATGPMAHVCMRNHRSFIRLDYDLYVIVDDLYTYAESEFAWLLHYNGTITEDGAKMTIAGEKAKAEITSIVPGGFTREIREHDGIEYIAIKQNARQRLCNIMTVISLSGNTQVSELTGEDQYGCEIRRGNDVYRVIYNYEADGRRMHVNSGNRILGYDTDTYILCDINNGEHTIMAYGSYLRKDGVSVYENLKKDFIIL